MKWLIENLKAIVIILSIPIWLNVGASCARANATEPLIKIAIIDTGYNPDLLHGPKLKLCKSGHYDFIKNQPKIGYTHQHGSHVADLIARELKGVDYCAIIFTTMKANESWRNFDNNLKALDRISQMDITVVNASYDGIKTNIQERNAITKVSNRNIKLFFAAGNDGKNLDYECDVFPACFEITNLVSVGALDLSTGEPASYSNHGKRISEWFSGDYFGVDRGTSYAVPRAVSAYVKNLVKLTDE